MLKKILRALRDQRGITGLETAIILIAFVVVAAVFAYTALSAGIFAAQKGQETIYKGMKQASGSLQLKGSVIAKDTDADNQIDEILVTLSNSVGGESIDLTPPAGSSNGIGTGTAHKTIITYADKNQRKTNINWSQSLVSWGDSDNLLETGEEFLITVDMTAIDNGSNPLAKDTEFTLEISPVQGSALVISRVTPNYIDPIVDLR